MNVTHNQDGAINFTQPHLIDQIVADVNFTADTKAKKMLAMTTKLLQNDLELPDHKASWKYTSIIGKLNFLEKSTRPNIVVATHQCACFMANPKATHTEVVHNIVCYLMGTPDKGLTFKPDSNKQFEIYANADFCGL